VTRSPENPDLIRGLEEAYAATLADWVLAVPLPQRVRTGVQVYYPAGATCTLVADIASTLPNQVLGLGIEEPVTEELLEEIIRFYGSTATDFLLQLSPLARPSDLKRLLLDQGFVGFGRSVQMVGDARPPSGTADTRLRVERVGKELAGVYGEIAERGFAIPGTAFLFAAHVGRPSWTAYLAYESDDPVAFGSLRVDGDVGILYGAGTLAEHRGKGAQSALIAARIEDATAAGCKILTVETGEERNGVPNPSFRNLQRMGFRVAYFRERFLYRFRASE
jgi:GNAT superfamily N-acetyltransferase